MKNPTDSQKIPIDHQQVHTIASSPQNNLKDPTLGTRLYWLLLLGTIVLIVHMNDANVLLDERIRRSFNDVAIMRNVTCIAHDAKFTCDCQNVNEDMILPHLIGYVFQVEISNCRRLTIKANALEGTQGLRKVNLKNIHNLVLNKYSLAFPRYASSTPLIIEFEKVNFELIDSHAINGNIEEISFIGGRIDVIHPFGFTTLKDRAVLLKMDNMLVRKIEPQAFKKFAIEQMEISNCIFETDVPSKAFYELEVLNVLKIYNVRFKKVHTRAFSFQEINKLVITKNQFDSIDAEWMEAHIGESIVIHENYFGDTSTIAFKGIKVRRDYNSGDRLELRFTNNTIQLQEDTPVRPLEFTEHFLIYIKQLQYNNSFSCKDVDYTQRPPRPKSPFFASFSDTIYFRMRSKVANANQHFLALDKIIESDCQQKSYMLYIVLGILTLVILIVIIATATWFLLAKRRKRRKMDVVMPEPRTYKETQIVYQIENAGLLKTDL